VASTTRSNGGNDRPAATSVPKAPPAAAAHRRQASDMAQPARSWPTRTTQSAPAQVGVLCCAQRSAGPARSERLCRALSASTTLDTSQQSQRQTTGGRSHELDHDPVLAHVPFATPTITPLARRSCSTEEPRTPD
jgi:hypothetical protein